MENEDNKIIYKVETNNKDYIGKFKSPKELEKSFSLIYDKKDERFIDSKNTIPHRKLFKEVTDYSIYFVPERQISIKFYTKIVYKETEVNEAPSELPVPYDLKISFDFDGVKEYKMKNLVKTFGYKTTTFNEIKERIVLEINLLIKDTFSKLMEEGTMSAIGLNLKDISDEIKKNASEEKFFKDNGITINSFIPSPTMESNIYEILRNKNLVQFSIQEKGEK